MYQQGSSLRSLSTDSLRIAATCLNARRETGRSVFEQWREVHSPAYEMIALDGGENFSAFNTVHNVHDIMLVDSFISGGLYKRDARRVAHAEEIIWLQQFRAGKELIQIGDDAFKVHPGKLFFCDGRYPSLIHSGPVSLRNVLIPARLLDWWDERTQPARHLEIMVDAPIGRILSDALNDLYVRVTHAHPDEAHTISRGFVRLLNDIMSRQPHARASTRVREALSISMQRHLIRNLDCPDIDVDDLCRTFHCSRAKVYRLFEPMGGVHRFLREQRLLRCCELLASTSPEEHTVRSITEYWGFENPSHFHRLFTGTFGIAPGEAQRSTAIFPDASDIAPVNYQHVHDWLKEG